MSKAALFVKHKAKPGLRDDVRRVWEKHVQPRVEANLAHEAYYFCYEDNDPDVIWIFQLYRDKESLDAFYPARVPVYLREVAQFVDAKPQVTAAAPGLDKGRLR